MTKATRGRYTLKIAENLAGSQQAVEIADDDSHISTAATTTRMSLILKTGRVKRYAF